MRAYNPGELRVPARHPDGGQWTRGGRGDTGSTEPQSLIHLVGDTDPEQPKPDPNANDSPEDEQLEAPGSIPEAVLARVLSLVRGLGLAAEVEAELFRVLTGTSAPEAPPEGIARTIDVSRSRFGEAAQHLDDAIAEGYPDVLTIDRASRDKNRSAALRGFSRVPGMELDEYPPAMFKEGGVGASVRLIDWRSNRQLGTYIGNLCRPFPSGAKIKIQIRD